MTPACTRRLPRGCRRCVQQTNVQDETCLKKISQLENCLLQFTVHGSLSVYTPPFSDELAICRFFVRDKGVFHNRKLRELNLQSGFIVFKFVGLKYIWNSIRKPKLAPNNNINHINDWNECLLIACNPLTLVKPQVLISRMKGNVPAVLPLHLTHFLH